MHAPTLLLLATVIVSLATAVHGGAPRVARLPPQHHHRQRPRPAPRLLPGRRHAAAAAQVAWTVRLRRRALQQQAHRRPVQGAPGAHGTHTRVQHRRWRLRQGRRGVQGQRRHGLRHGAARAPGVLRGLRRGLVLLRGHPHRHGEGRVPGRRRCHLHLRRQRHEEALLQGPHRRREFLGRHVRRLRLHQHLERRDHRPDRHQLRPVAAHVAASTMSRRVVSKVQLGNGLVLYGETRLRYKRVKNKPLVYVAGMFEDGALKRVDVRSKIVACDRMEDPVMRAEMIQKAGGVGMISWFGVKRGSATTTPVDNITIAASRVPHADGETIVAYINSTANPTDSLRFAGAQLNKYSGPAIAEYSSRGPCNVSNVGVIKPDITGPGTNIVAAVPGSHPGGNASAPTDEMTGRPASHFAMGARLVNPTRALDPGLVYDLAPAEYISYVCGSGTTRASSTTSSAQPMQNVSCAASKKIDGKDLNYPSIMVMLTPSAPEVEVRRAVTNVGDAVSVYAYKPASICSYAVVGDVICISTIGVGTYCFDTVSHEWSRAGDWMLPFYGKSEYVPELNLWFGVSDLNYKLPCAADLSPVVRGQQPEEGPIWEDFDRPEEWYPCRLCPAKIVSLGSGRFCITNFFETMELNTSMGELFVDEIFAVFTGVEVFTGNGRNGNVAVSGNANGKGIRGLRMIKHKSRHCRINNTNVIHSVL